LACSPPPLATVHPAPSSTLTGEIKFPLTSLWLRNPQLCRPLPRLYLLPPQQSRELYYPFGGLLKTSQELTPSGSPSLPSYHVMVISLASLSQRWGNTLFNCFFLRLDLTLLPLPLSWVVIPRPNNNSSPPPHLCQFLYCSTQFSAGNCIVQTIFTKDVFSSAFTTTVSGLSPPPLFFACVCDSQGASF